MCNLYSFVHSFMQPQISCSTKMLFILFASKKFLSWVNSLVCQKVCSLLKTFVTLFTFIRLFPYELFHASANDPTCLRKAFVTLFTFIRLLPCVNSFVCPKNVCVPYTLATLLMLMFEFFNVSLNFLNDKTTCNTECSLRVSPLLLCVCSCAAFIRILL